MIIIITVNNNEINLVDGLIIINNEFYVSLIDVAIILNINKINITYDINNNIAKLTYKNNTIIITNNVMVKGIVYTPFNVLITDILNGNYFESDNNINITI